MNIIKLDTDSQGWILGKVSLYEYISSLTAEKFKYDIQRGVVSNPYLDTILDSIVSKTPLQPISLVASYVVDNSDNITINDYNILDGLQRTCRLWIYYQLADISEKEKTLDYKIATEKLKKSCDFYYQAVAPRQVRKLFLKDSSINVTNLKEIYSNYYLYLYIWSGLTPETEAKTMLILNAGQKRMSLSHQFELMYLRLFEKYTMTSNQIKLIREKDVAKMDKSRAVGEYKIPTVIIGIQSLLAGKPIRLSSDILYKESEKDNMEELNFQSADNLFGKNFIDGFLDSLYKLDCQLSTDKDSNIWFSKDTTISGIMAGIGMSRLGHYMSDDILDHLRQSVKKLDDINMFRIDEYQKAYANLSSVRINIGMVVRKAIAAYVSDLLSDIPNTASWAKSFSKVINL